MVEACSVDPEVRDERFRIEMTSSCQDCLSIAKVDNAGQIVVERGERVQIMHNGLRVLAGGYHGAWMAEIIGRLRGHHEPQEELLFHHVLDYLGHRPTMIEIGSFWAYYSLWFLQRHPEGCAIAVEPDPNSLEVGRRNAALNNSSITFVQANAGAESEPARPFVTETAGVVTVPQVTVSDLLAEHAIDILDILHCDAQGAELAVIGSCLGLLAAGRVRFCVVSTHAHQITGDPLTHQKCLHLLRSSGVGILAEHDVHESFSGDGLIVTYSGAEPLNWPDLNFSYNRYSTSLFPNPLYDLERAMRTEASE